MAVVHGRACRNHHDIAHHLRNVLCTLDSSDERFAKRTVNMLLRIA